MNEKDPFAKYDKLFEEQDKEHDEQVKEYRNEVVVKDNPSFDDLRQDEKRANQKNTKDSNQAIGIVISIVVGFAILRNLLFSTQNFFGSIIPVIILIIILSNIYKYFKDKR